MNKTMVMTKEEAKTIYEMGFKETNRVTLEIFNKKVTPFADQNVNLVFIVEEYVIPYKSQTARGHLFSMALESETLCSKIILEKSKKFSEPYTHVIKESYLFGNLLNLAAACTLQNTSFPDRIVLKSTLNDIFLPDQEKYVRTRIENILLVSNLKQLGYKTSFRGKRCTIIASVVEEAYEVRKKLEKLFSLSQYDSNLR